VLCISAHWRRNGVSLAASVQLEIIHDFYGFPEQLFDVRYRAPGGPALARRVAELLAEAGAG
jgi:4,5-DOPA dioxygenase extradiol